VIPQFDVFLINDNKPIWLGAVEALVQAFEIARNTGTGTYMVLSQQTGHKTAYTVDATGAIRPTHAIR
jgi:hypothetical protein